MLRIFINLLLIAAISASTQLKAEEEDKEPLRYFKINPNILTTYQTTGKKMKYIVVQVQIVVRGEKNYDLIELHMPLLQDALTDFFNRQDKSTIEDLKQRETLRQQATERVSQVIEEETGEDIVKNVIFTQYIFQ